jgi:hypothetical protein
MAHWRLLIPTKYLSFADLRGRDVTVTIESVERTEMAEKDQKTKKTRKVKKAVINFVGKDKQLALNVTNASTIVDLYGSETDNWKGKAITLYPTTCHAFGNADTECIRVRPHVPSQSTPTTGADQ